MVEVDVSYCPNKFWYICVNYFSWFGEPKLYTDATEEIQVHESTAVAYALVPGRRLVIGQSRFTIKENGSFKGTSIMCTHA